MEEKQVRMITVDDQLKLAAPNLTLGIVHTFVQVEKRNEELWSKLKGTGRKISRTFQLEGLGNNPELAALRSVYQKLGKDPSRYRGSAEALVRRVLQGKGLYQINTIVDINNLVSLNTMCSVGVYDLAELQPPLIFRVGQDGETYKGIGKETVNIAGLPVFADALGPYGSPTSDSERAMITEKAKEIMVVIIKFTGSEKLEQYLQGAIQLLVSYAYARPETTETMVVK